MEKSDKQFTLLDVKQITNDVYPAINLFTGDIVPEDNLFTDDIIYPNPILDLWYLAENNAYKGTKLDLFNKISAKAPITDYARYMVDHDSKASLDGYWTKTFVLNEKNRPNGDMFIINSNGIVEREGGFNYVSKDFGIRPAVKYSQIKDECINRYRDENGILIVEYGEYPQEELSPDIENKLEQYCIMTNFNNSRLSWPGYSYDNSNLIIHNDKVYHTIYDETDKPAGYEFLVAGQKYFRANYYDNSECRGRFLKGKSKWFKVSPIKWLVSEKDDLAVSNSILLSSMIHSSYEFLENGKMHDYLNNVFAKDIIPSTNNYEKFDKIVLSSCKCIPDIGINLPELGMLLANFDSLDREIVIEISVRNPNEKQEDEQISNDIKVKRITKN